MEEQKTIQEWEVEFETKIIDPDGFDRTDSKLYEREFTRAEFTKGLMNSTCYLSEKMIKENVI